MSDTAMSGKPLKISELIAELERLKAEHGDVLVANDTDEDGLHNFYSIEYRAECQVWSNRWLDDKQCYKGPAVLFC